ncbi:MAG: hypothetical protein RL375_4484, partial [Pseudomonadota bacterium]
MVDEGLNLRPDHDDLQDAKLRDLEKRVEGKTAWGHRMIDQTQEQKEAEIERRAQQRVASMIEGLPALIADAVERAHRRVLTDPEIRGAFWKAGYDELEKHAGTALAQYIGKKVIHILLAAG